MRKFDYKFPFKFGVALLQLGGSALFIIVLLIALFMISQINNVEYDEGNDFILNDPRFTLVCLSLWVLLVGCFVCIILINSFTTILLEESGITITAFLFAKIFIPWSDIVRIEVGRVRFGNDLVQARRNTPFHIFYGWLYSRTLHPSFIIGKNINDHDVLIKAVSENINNTDIIKH